MPANVHRKGLPLGHPSVYYQLSAKLKDGPSGYFHGRFLFTYTQSDGKWLIMSMHISPLTAASVQHPPL